VSGAIGRREFLGALAAAGAVALSPAVAAPRSHRRFGLQLYTARRELARDFSGTLARIAAIGYDEVEFAGYHGNPPAAVRASLRAAGLSAPSAHIGMPDIEGDWPRAVADAAAVGHDYLIFAWVPDAHRTADGYKRLAERFNRAGETALAAGVRFGYHNYTYDFTRVGSRFLYDVLLAETDPRYVTMQMDVYWLVDAGQDPRAYLTRHPGRYSSLHLKDRTADGQMADVGSGTIDWARIIPAAGAAGARHLFVEHDDPADPFVSARTSLSHLRALRI
jgi:sugar phosphate isomerase/epimerase